MEDKRINDNFFGVRPLYSTNLKRTTAFTLGTVKDMRGKS